MTPFEFSYARLNFIDCCGRWGAEARGKSIIRSLAHFFHPLFDRKLRELRHHTISMPIFSFSFKNA